MKQIIKFCVISLLLIIYEGTIFGQTFKKVTNISELQNGDVIAIVNEANNQALSTKENQKKTNREATPITIKDGCFNSTTFVQEITLESCKDSNKWYLKVGTDDYLYAEGSSPTLESKNIRDKYSRASITFSEGNALINFSGKNPYNQIAYYKPKELFSAYKKDGQLKVQIYKKQTDKLTPSSLSFGSTNDNHTFFKNAGDKFTLPATLTPTIKGATIRYTSSNPSVASVNEKTGEVTALQEGDTEITASFAGNDTYLPSSASYTIHVNKEGFFDFTQTENDYGSKCTPGSKSFFNNSTWKAGKVTLTTKAKSEGFRWWKNTDDTYDFRAYSNSVFTISVAEGYYITSITMKGAIPSSSLKANDENIENGKWSGMSKSVEFKPSNTLYIKSITVNYTQQQESLTTAASGFATYAANYPVDYSKLGLTVYEVAVNQEQTGVVYRPFVGAVPAGMAVLVQGVPNKEYSLTPATVADHSYKTDLRASDGTVKAADSEIYAFATLRGVSGFKLVTDGVVIPAKKGYLKLTSAGSAKSFFAFDDVDTGIGHIDANNMGTTSVVYNLAGQRVDKYYKGIVIENGKKIIRK